MALDGLRWATVRPSRDAPPPLRHRRLGIDGGTRLRIEHGQARSPFEVGHQGGAELGSSGRPASSAASSNRRTHWSRCGCLRRRLRWRDIMCGCPPRSLLYDAGPRAPRRRSERRAGGVPRSSGRRWAPARHLLEPSCRTSPSAVRSQHAACPFEQAGWRLGWHRGRPGCPPYPCSTWCTAAIAIDPSPTAEATRFRLPDRTSPTAKTPGRLVSSRWGGRASGHFAVARSSGNRSGPVLMNPCCRARGNWPATECWAPRPSW